MAESRVQNSIYNIITGLFGQLLVMVTGFIVRTVFIKCLGNTYLGVSGLFGNVLNILSLAELGIGQAIIFSLYRPIAEKDENKICALMKLYERVYRKLFCVVLVLGISMVPFLPYFIKDMSIIPNIYIIYVMYVFNSAISYLFVYKSTFLTANQQNYVISIISYAFNIGIAIIQIICLVIFRRYLLYLGIQIFSTIFQNIYISKKVDKIYPFLRKKEISPLENEELIKIKQNVKALMIYKIGTLSLNSTDNIIISKYVGIVTVGLYSNYLLIISSVTGFLSTIFGNVTASIGNLNAKESKEKQYFMFKVINLSTFWLYSVVTVCVFFLINDFIEFCWIGSEYLLSLSETLIISLNIYIGGMLFAPFNYRQTMGLFVQGKIRPVVSAIENIVVSVLLAKYWGLAGVLWGTAITRLTTNVWYDPFIVFRNMGVNPVKYFADYFIKFFVLCVTSTGAFFIQKSIVVSGVITWIVKAIIIFVFVNTVFCLIFFRTKEFDYLKNVVVNILKKFFSNKHNLKYRK